MERVNVRRKVVAPKFKVEYQGFINRRRTTVLTTATIRFRISYPQTKFYHKQHTNLYE